jgi:hypothetical protein
VLFSLIGREVGGGGLVFGGDALVVGELGPGLQPVVAPRTSVAGESFAIIAAYHFRKISPQRHKDTKEKQIPFV